MPAIFTQQETQKMHSPERLNTLVEVTKPRGWIALTAVCILIFDALIWSIFGSLPLTVKGEGILLKNKVINIDAKATGVLMELKVQPGFRVQPGDVVAVLRLVDEESKLTISRAKLELLEADKRSASGEEEAERKAKLAALDSEARTIPVSIAEKEKVRQALAAQLVKYEEGVRGGYTLEAERNQVMSEHVAAIQEIAKMRQQLEEIKAKREEAMLSRADKGRMRDMEINKLRGEIEELVRVIAEKSKVHAEVAGVVLEHMVATANMVSEGKPIMRVEPENSEIEAVIYVPAEEAKKIRVDKRGHPVTKVRANISPSTVKPEEHGFIIGTVSNVSIYPVTKAGIMQVINTDVLAEKLVKEGAPIEVRATLMRNPNPESVSGYRWTSSGKGPAIQIASGTLCDGTFEVDRKRPISYVIPAIRKLTGL